jgi:hypothetical protein
VLQKSDNRSGEFHAWWIDGDGKAMSWFLPEYDNTSWAGDVSKAWCNLEMNAFDENPSVKTFRLVSDTVLIGEPIWEFIFDYRQHLILSPVNCCLYESNDVSSPLFELLKAENISKYDELTDILNAGIEGDLMVDPLDIYLARHSRACPIRHFQILNLPEGYPDISKVDFEAALAMLDCKQST